MRTYNWGIIGASKIARKFAEDLKRLSVPLVLVVGEADRNIRPAEAAWVHRLLPASSRIVSFGGLGHLAHEEQPQRIADAVLAFAGELGLLREGG